MSACLYKVLAQGRLQASLTPLLKRTKQQYVLPNVQL